MKILLTAVNAKYIHSNLAVYSLRAAARGYRESVDIAEFTINNRKDYILQQIYRRKPDVLCFSCYIWNIGYVEYLVREFGKLCPHVPIWVGGPEVSYEAEEFLRGHKNITGVMIGEGEDTFRELCAYYAGHKGRGKPPVGDGAPSPSRIGSGKLADIAGLVFRGDGEKEIIRTQDREPADLNSLPFAYETTEDFADRIIYYESSRGCPFSCSYCLSSVDKRLRFRSPELVKRELMFFQEQRVKQVKFVDRTFNCNHTHAAEIWRFLRENDNGVTNFHFEISAELLNEEELSLLEKMRPGQIQLEIGVQSVNERTIREIHRTANRQRLEENVRRLRKGGNIHLHLDLIAGLPFEDYRSLRRSFDEIYGLCPNQLQLGFLKVLKGSELYYRAGDYGIVYHNEPPYEVLYTDRLKYEEVLAVKQAEEMLEVYYNSGQFEITVKLLYVIAESAFDFFRKLGDFYERKGYFSMSHSRIRRCEILLEFLQEGERGWRKPDLGMEDAGLMEMIRESLVFDLYYRENCKTRPVWAADLRKYQEKRISGASNGKMFHLEPFHYLFSLNKEEFPKELPERRPEPVWALFRYDARNPLDHQAKTEYL